MHTAVVLLLGVALVAATPQPQKEYARIIGGSVTTINQYPFAVAMLQQSGSNFFQACGGTVINNRAILTAAHCYVRASLASQWRCRVGSTYANSGGSVYNTASIIRHPNYNTNNEDFDIAIIRVSGTINAAAASIAGANYNLGDNQPVWAIGWGVTESGWASEQLRHVQVWTVNQQVCAQRYATRGYWISNNMLCSGWLDVGGRDQCQGDSGGPLLHNNVVVGVCSWGIGCADSFFPGVNARVSTSTNWIVSNS